MQYHPFGFSSLLTNTVFASASSWLQDFYSVHGDNALFIARTFYKTTAVVKYAGGQANGLPGISEAA